MAHRASTELRHPVLSLAADLACPHVFHPALCRFFSTVHLQLVFGLPCFLLPSGVHVSAVLQLLSCCLNVCPMNFLLIFLISVFSYFIPVLAYNSLLLIRYCHLIFNILLKHFIWNTLIFRLLSSSTSRIRIIIVLPTLEFCKV